MPISTRELSRIAKVSEQTVRNYTRDFGALLSPAARGEAGQRLFDDQDVQVFCTIATLRKEGVPPGEVIERVRRGDMYIEATPSRPQATPSAQHPTTPPQNDTAAHSDDLLLPVALSSLQSQMDALRADFRTMQRQHIAQQQHQEAQQRGATLWAALLGVIVGLVAAALFMWGLYLFG